LAQEEQRRRLALIEEAEKKQWSLKRMREAAVRAGHRDLAISIINGVSSISRINLRRIIDEFGADKANAYWSAFSACRGQNHSVTYLTEESPAERYPLIRISDVEALCPSVNAIYTALLSLGESIMATHPNRESFYKSRDKALESEAANQFSRIFRNSAKQITGAFETHDFHFEHDLLLVWERKLLVVEAKASPPTEPFRDPDKAYIRLQRGFRSDGGIQKAFNQAERLRAQWAQGDIIRLFDRHGEEVTLITPAEIDGVYTICVTRDDFGPLAVDLSLLLQKDDTAPYPWAVNIVDLETIADAWEYFNWGGTEFLQYLDDR
jgi:hypothetical protein